MEIFKMIIYIFGIIILIVFILSNTISIRFKKRVKNEIRTLKDNQDSIKGGEIGMKDISHLPDNVKKWLIKSGVVGSTWKKYAYIEEKGYMKLDMDKDKWIYSSAKHYVGLIEPSFVWSVKAEMMPFVYTYGRDLFLEGIGSLEMRVLNILKVVDVYNGNKLNQSTFQRYLMEMPWYPQAALNRNMKWTSIDKYTAKVVMSHRGVVGEVYYYFNDEGEVQKVSAMRYKDIKPNSPMFNCIGEVTEYKVVDHKIIPNKVNVTWKLPNIDYNWFNVEVTKIEYN